MLRGMVFVDHMNFDIALRQLYQQANDKPPRLDYNTVFRGIVALLNHIDYLKTFIFTPTPDDFLMEDPFLLNYYKWMQGMKNSRYLEIIEGRYLARPILSQDQMDINDKTTYYKVEKGTDINLAVHALTKAYFNSYDVAFVVSADSDYRPVYQHLKNIGKIVVLVCVQGQNIGSLRAEVDNFIVLDKPFFDRHLRP